LLATETWGKPSDAVVWLLARAMAGWFHQNTGHSHVLGERREGGLGTRERREVGNSTSDGEKRVEGRHEKRESGGCGRSSAGCSGTQSNGWTEPQVKGRLTGGTVVCQQRHLIYGPSEKSSKPTRTHAERYHTLVQPTSSTLCRPCQ
jgi:hypothetical protein